MRHVTPRMLVAGCLALAVSGACSKRAGGSATSVSGVRLEQVDGKALYTNRLITEKSPYLQLHAHNPVDWFSWGSEAFDRARREHKPIFLSVGYSTCHWCHVMETESFSDPAIAELMNRYFVSIKVDREERPDVDRVYMSYVIMLGAGGWPMSVFLTPDLEPFVGGGYYPPDDRDGNIGFRTLLQRISADWTNKRDMVLQAAKSGAAVMEAGASGLPASGSRPALGTQVLDQTYRDLKASYDAANGGFGTGQKFPRPVALNFLLREHARTGSKAALDMVLETLRAMARGGIHDQLGGGFHRYATDRAWRVPHFEKMLYDQAQLAVSYSEAYQITKDRTFAYSARDILEYVLRDMRDGDGGFFSAEDADSSIESGGSRRIEGAFYVWTSDEIRRVVGGDLAPMFAFHYGVQLSGNVPPTQDVRRELEGKNVLFVAHTLDETAAKFSRPIGEVRTDLDAALRKLREARGARARPARDDKVLADWNGLMISAFARASQVLDDPRYLEAAQASARFIETRMYDEKANVLKRRYRQGQADIDALLEDYAYLVQGLLDLYEASFDVKWLSWAARLQTRQDELFWDAKGGGYFSTPASASHILVRMKGDYDGAEPSANSVAALNLLRLWQATEGREWRTEADRLFGALGPRLIRSPSALPQLAVAVNFSLSKPKQIVVAGEPGAADTRKMLRLVHERFIPNKILMLVDGGPAQEQLARLVSVVGTMGRRDGRATIYVCENYACRLPTNDVRTAARLLDGKPTDTAEFR